eukprot:7918309-Pyramimonas_sp.AAC.1
MHLRQRSLGEKVSPSPLPSGARHSMTTTRQPPHRGRPTSAARAGPCTPARGPAPKPPTP